MLCGVVHVTVRWGWPRCGAGGTSGAPTTCAMVFLRGGRDAWHRWPPCRRGKGGRERNEVRWVVRGHSSGVLRRSARCWGHSWSHSYMASLKNLLVDGVWLSDLCRSSAWRYTSLGRNTVALGRFFKSPGTKTYKRSGRVRVASFKRTAPATGWASASRSSSMLWASPATSSSRVAECCFYVR